MENKKRVIKFKTGLSIFFQLIVIFSISFIIIECKFTLLRTVISFIYLGIYSFFAAIFIRRKNKRKIKKMFLKCSLEDVDQMTGIDFEYFLYHKFKERKYKVKLTPVTGDYGADLILYKNWEKTVVQAKRYQSGVGIKAVQEVIGSIAYYGADKGIVITNSYFTPNAINLAKANDIILWDRDVLINELLEEDRTEKLTEKRDLGQCPYCGQDLIFKNGKYGEFIGCSGYPNCNYTSSLDKSGKR